MKRTTVFALAAVAFALTGCSALTPTAEREPTLSVVTCETKTATVMLPGDITGVEVTGGSTEGAQEAFDNWQMVQVQRAPGAKTDIEVHSDGDLLSVRCPAPAPVLKAVREGDAVTATVTGDADIKSIAVAGGAITHDSDKALAWRSLTIKPASERAVRITITLADGTELNTAA